jgi:DNA-binding MarR family transcriptional regulator
MDVESRRDLQLLEALEQESYITQRSLAERLGIALGLTNLYLKRLIRKGYVKSVTVSPHRLMYSLTPKGMARKARLTYEFMKYSLDFYRDARRHLRRSLGQAVGLGQPVSVGQAVSLGPAVRQQKRVAIYGTGDAAELVFLLIREMGLELVAVFAAESNGHFLGFPVIPIDTHADVAYDVMVIAVLERPAGTAKRLAQAGVPSDKIVMLRPDWPAPVGSTTNRTE